MSNPITQYAHWLHLRWPAGKVEKLPEVRDDGTTTVPGVRIVGDLTGIPLLKFSSDSGARAIHAILRESDFNSGRSAEDDLYDVAIVGAGVSGVSAAMEARKAGLKYVIFEASQIFSTVANFPRGKPIYTYPTEMTPEGGIQYNEKTKVKEGLLEEMERQRKEAGVEITEGRIERIERRGGELILHHSGKSGKKTRARRVIVGIGRSGNFRKLGVPGEDRDKVSNRLHDPKDFCQMNVMVVGGGDSAMEAAIALAVCGANVTLSYRKPVFSRPKPENIEKIEALAADPDSDVAVEEPISERITTSAAKWMRENRPAGSLTLAMNTSVERIEADKVLLKDNESGETCEIPNDNVFAMIGREPPLDFFRRSGIRITGEMGAKGWIGMGLFVLFCFWLYHWKGGYKIPLIDVKFSGWLNPNPGAYWKWLDTLGGWWSQQIADPTTLIHTLSISAGGRAFYYSLLYSLIVVVFGILRVRRRKTPYVKLQTTVLAAIQVLPLFLLPEIILPLLGHNGIFSSGLMHTLADSLFPEVTYGHGREYWRAYGLILAWPLFVYNWFTESPMWGWLIIGAVQTFVLIPGLIYFWGKGAYCGWICSCGALAETLGDQVRHKMPHGPKWNRLNMLGQGVLLFATVLFILRILAWSGVGWANKLFYEGFKSVPLLNYAWFVDLMLAGVLGYGLYFWYSGRMWCRFACPLAALMHIYARFTKFRIFPEKSKCISCNVCTSVCHQGIDIMNFANKGIPMQDPECVRCSACVQQCPTGVLTFGRFQSDGKIRLDALSASPVRMRESNR